MKFAANSIVKRFEKRAEDALLKLVRSLLYDFFNALMNLVIFGFLAKKHRKNNLRNLLVTVRQIFVKIFILIVTISTNNLFYVL